MNTNTIEACLSLARTLRDQVPFNMALTDSEVRLSDTARLLGQIADMLSAEAAHTAEA